MEDEKDPMEVDDEEVEEEVDLEEEEEEVGGLGIDEAI